MAVLATAIDRTEDGATGDVDFDFVHIGPGIEHVAGVAHAGTEEHARDGIALESRHSARHANGTATHVDGGFAQHVGVFVAAIHTGKDVSGLDVLLKLRPFCNYLSVSKEPLVPSFAFLFALTLVPCYL